MKTLREYIDQLDEISRRDFLKGAGATVGATALGAPKDAKSLTFDPQTNTYTFDQTDMQIIEGLMMLNQSKNQKIFTIQLKTN
jgi:anaerobic selenocysteine-containing dehydrogenase